MLALIGLTMLLLGNTQADTCKQTIINAVNMFITNNTMSTIVSNSGKNINDMGMYTQCHALGNYTYYLFSIQGMFSMALCLPEQCNQAVVDSTRRDLSEFINKNIPLSPTPINETDIKFLDSFKLNKEFSKLSPNRIFWIIFICIFALIAVAATVYDCYQGKNALILCFSMRKNGSALLYSQNKVDKCLDILNGIRVLSMGWVMMGHTFETYADLPMLNPTNLFSDLARSWGMSIFYCTVSVDTFFCLSAFLGTFYMAQEMQKNMSCKLIGMLIVKRLLRLLPLYGMLFCWFFNIVPLFARGPIYFENDAILDTCRKHWYLNLLFVNNIFYSNGKLCFAWTWYISIDMQFFLISLLLNYLYIKSRLASLITAIALCLGSSICQALIVSLRGIPMGFIDNPKFFTDIGDIYYQPWTRINTYIIGIICAWIYLSYKKEQFRYPLYERINGMYKHRAVRYILYVLGLALITFTVFIAAWFNLYPTSSNSSIDSAFCIFQRVLFVVGFMLIAYSAMLGHIGVLLNVLGSPIFNFLSRITYGAYLFHVSVIAIYIGATLQGFEYSPLYLVLKAIDIFCVSYMLSFVLTLIFDSPVVCLEKMLLAPQRKQEYKQVELKEVQTNK